MRFAAILLGASSVLALATQAQAAADAGSFGLGEIIVTAPRQTSGVAIDTTTLSSEAIYAFNRATLDDAASLIPGVSSANTGGSRNERLIYVRGFNRFQAPLSIDGVRVFLPADNRLDYGRFLTPDIASIQVAKGYVSVLNGPDGMGGAVNLVTRTPTKALEAEGRITTDLDREGKGQGYSLFGLLGTRRDAWYVQGSYARNQVDHTTLPDSFSPTATEDGGRRDLSRAEDWRLNLKAGWTPNDTDEYSISYTRQEGEKAAPLSTTDPLSIQRFWTWPYWNLDSLYFLSSTQLGGRYTLKTKAYYNTFENLLRSFDTRAETTQTLGRAFNSYYDDNAYGGAAQLAAQLTDRNRLTGAIDYRRDEHVEWQQSFPGGATEPKQTTIEGIYSFALEDVARLTDRLTLTLGASYDWRDLRRAEDYTAGAYVRYPLKDGDAWNAQGRLDWQVNETAGLYASVSSRARFPTLFDRFSSRVGGAVSNPGLAPERAANYEVGGSVQAGAVHAEAALFYTHISDAIVSVPFIFNSCAPAGVCTANAVTQSRNVGDGDTYGLELSASAVLSARLTVGGNYTYLHRELNDPSNRSLKPTDTPTHKGFVYADWRPAARLHVLPNLDLASDRWTVTSAGTRYYRTGAYVLLNARVDYDVTDQVQLGVGGRNLTDSSYQLVDGFPEQGRTFFISVRARY